MSEAADQVCNYTALALHKVALLHIVLFYWQWLFVRSTGLQKYPLHWYLFYNPITLIVVVKENDEVKHKPKQQMLQACIKSQFAFIIIIIQF